MHRTKLSILWGSLHKNVNALFNQTSLNLFKGLLSLQGVRHHLPLVHQHDLLQADVLLHVQVLAEQDKDEAVKEANLQVEQSFIDLSPLKRLSKVVGDHGLPYPWIQVLQVLFKVEVPIEQESAKIDKSRSCGGHLEVDSEDLVVVLPQQIPRPEVSVRESQRGHHGSCLCLEAQHSDDQSHHSGSIFFT